MNGSLARLGRWDKDEIEKRTTKLIELAIEIWPFPKIDQLVLDQYKEKVEKVGEDISEEDHFEKGSELTKHINEIIKSNILSIGSNISIDPKIKYMLLYVIQILWILFFRGSHLDLYLNIKKGTLVDPMQLTRDTSSQGHWGNGDYVITLTNIKEIDNIIPLIRQSYDEN